MTISFERGEVFGVDFSEIVYDSSNQDHVRGRPLPHTVIQGYHQAIVLSDSDSHDGSNLSTNHVVVVPISSAKAAVEKGNLLVTHIDLEPKNNTFLSHKCYALVHQPITIPIHWLRQNKRKGKVCDEDMEVINLSLLLSTGCSEHVQAMIQDAINQTIKEYSFKPGDLVSSDE
ncbi:type II toxin-antitoxin system PemK/MazF family toxin [Brevundimonas sp. NPDC058933]|uniref:type II toxin-antitoxin system PemK/MazF family toxin n=1 Tax=Brevundimonas sp. NPDC058933 TaxID=3346673 RepID=UPI003BEF01A4